MANSNQLFITKKRLTAWGNWCHHIVTMGLGYSNQSLIAKLQQEGGMIIKGTNTLLIPSNEDAEEIDALLNQLAANEPNGVGKPQWANVVRIHYTQRHKNNAAKALSVHLNERTYKRYLHHGINWLADTIAKK